MYNTVIFKKIEDVQEDLGKLKQFYKDIGADKVSQIAKGENIKVAVLDSGIDMHHPKLLNRVHGQFNGLTNNQDLFIDRVGHGTYISGLICGKQIGLVQNISHYAVKVTDDYGHMNVDTVINGLKWCINNQIDVIVMALGTKKNYPELEYYIKLAHGQGSIVIASAGNNPLYLEYPARYEEVLCVGSIDYSLKRTGFSTSGEELDIVLPAVDIPSTYSFGRYALASGSSSATAIAANIVVMLQYLRQKQVGVNFNSYQLRRWFKENTIDLGVAGFDNIYGLGMPTFKNLIKNNYRVDYF